MKKIVFTLAALLISIATLAQTNFRQLTYKEALAAAKSENKKVFLDFYTDWCGPCKMMMRTVFPTKVVGDYMNKHFVSVKMNAEKGEGIELAKKYTIKAYPTFVILDPSEKEVGRVVGGSSADNFVSKLEPFVDPSKAPALIKKRYENGERSAEVVKAYASNLVSDLQDGRYERNEYIKKYGEIEKLVQDYYGKLSDKDKVKEENMFVYRDFTSSPFTASGRFLYKSIDKFPKARKAEMDSIRTQLYLNEVNGLLSGTTTYDAAKFAELKKEFKELGVDKGTDYTPVYTLIEGYAKDDKKAYITLCGQLYDKLTTNQQAYLLENYAAHFTDADEATKKEAAQFLRKHFGNQSFNVMYFTLMQIGQLEGMTH